MSSNRLDINVKYKMYNVDKWHITLNFFNDCFMKFYNFQQALIILKS